MAFAKILDTTQTALVSRQLGLTIGRFHHKWFPNDRAELGESFELHMLAHGVISSPERWLDDLQSLLIKTDLWQHQVSSSGAAIGLAQSVLCSGGERRLASFLRSARATKFSEAISRVDRERVSEEIEVLLVTAPALQVDFFILRSPSGMEVLLIASTSASKDLVEGRYYPFHEFLRLLSAAPRLGGLGIS